PHRAGPARRGDRDGRHLVAGPTADAARDQPARCFRGRRRPAGLGQAGRLRRGRGRGHHPAHPPQTGCAGRGRERGRAVALVRGNDGRSIGSAELPGRPGPGAQPPAGGIRPLVPGMRVLLFVAAVLVLLAGFQLYVFTERTDTFFAWTIVNPLAAAFLGGAYWASFAIEALAGRQTVWANARIAVPTVLVFTVLTLAATLIHLNKFHLGSQFGAGTRIVTWAWIAIYALVPALMLIVLVVQARTPGGDPPRTAPLPGWLYVLVAGQAVILFGLGVALFTAPVGAAPAWPWA